MVNVEKITPLRLTAPFHCLPAAAGSKSPSPGLSRRERGKCMKAEASAGCLVQPGHLSVTSVSSCSISWEDCTGVNRGNGGERRRSGAHRLIRCGMGVPPMLAMRSLRGFLDNKGSFSFTPLTRGRRGDCPNECRGTSGKPGGGDRGPPLRGQSQ